MRIILLFLTLFVALISACCEEIEDKCAGVNCPYQGYECDQETGACICPEGKIINIQDCVNVEADMYFPLAENKNSPCFHNITSVKLEELPVSYDILRLTIDTNQDDGLNLTTIMLSENTYNHTQDFDFVHKFYANLGNLPCDIDNRKTNAHVYSRIIDDTIRIRVDFFEYNPYWGQYPEYPEIIQTRELVFVK